MMKKLRLICVMGVMIALAPIMAVCGSGEGAPADAPEKLYFRTNTESFNSAYYAITRGGDIYIKPNTERTGRTGGWQKIELPPQLAGHVIQISIDDKFMMALDDSRALWQMAGATGDISSFKWYEYRGMPFTTGEKNILPADIVKWDWSTVSPEEDIYYTDHVGNRQKVGEATCAHLIVLKNGGQWISFNDGWLPADLNYEICGPERGRFRAINLSASGSSFFLINKYGDMFTTLWDFDLSGPATMFREYSYYDQTGLPNPKQQLPPAPWTMHPKINGRITNVISLHKIGPGTIHRTMRVEGVDASGNTGYFEKDITGMAPSDWQFHITGMPLKGQFIENTPEDMSHKDLGPSDDYYFARNMTATSALVPVTSPDAVTPDTWSAELLDFNCYCSPAILRIHLAGGKSFDLFLHTTEALRRKEKSGRGLDKVNREKNGNIEIPPAIWDHLDSQDPQIQAFIRHYFRQRHTPARVFASISSVKITVKQPERWDFDR